MSLFFVHFTEIHFIAVPSVCICVYIVLLDFVGPSANVNPEVYSL